MSETVLILDADKTARKELELVLSKEDYQVLSSGDYDAAMSIFDREKISVLISDIDLHGGNGWKLVLSQLAERPEIIAFVTARNVDLKLGRAVIKRGVREVLYKPFSFEKLTKKVSYAIRMREKLSPTTEAEPAEAEETADTAEAAEA